MKRQALIGFLAIAMLFGLQTFANAQEQAIRIVFPFAPGGSGDALARLLADKMRATINRPVIVENRTGGAGRIGVLTVKNSAPDGATLLITPIAPLAVYPYSYKSLDYDPITDFRPVSQICTFDFGVAVGANSSIRSLKDLVTWAKANPTQANYGIPAAGTLPHFLGAMFGRATGIDLRAVPYRGSTGAVMDLIGGQVPIVITTVSDLAEHHKSGKIRVLATSDRQRTPFIDNVPTLQEAGYDLVATGWYGIFVQAKTPPEVVDRLNKAVVAAVQLPDVKQQLMGFGLQPTGTSAADFARIQKTDSQFWAAAVKASGFTAEE